MSVEYDTFFLQSCDTVGWATGMASVLNKVGCQFVGGDDLAETFAHLIAPVVTTTSIILSFNKIENCDVLVLAYLGCTENDCQRSVVVSLLTFF